VEAAQVVRHDLLVLDLDGDRGIGCDVGDGRREDVGALLLHQAGALALLPRLLVRLLGGRPLADDALDDPVADPHPQMVDGRVLRQRKHVDAFGPLGARVAELLPDGGPDHEPGRPDVDLGGQPRRRHRRRLLRRPPE
jgi:hypothetical protein